MNTFWNKARCDFPWKLQVYNAIVVSKLTYGLETLQLTEALYKRLDAFQMRCLRKLMNIPSTYIDRSNTNEHVWKLAGEKLNTGRSNSHKPIKHRSEVIRSRQQALLGHVIRVAPTDPLKRVSFKNQNLEPVEDKTRRIGRPRIKWIHEAMTHAWLHIREQVNRSDEPYTGTCIQRQLIKTYAVNRATPFLTKTNSTTTRSHDWHDVPAQIRNRISTSNRFTSNHPLPNDRHRAL